MLDGEDTDDSEVATLWLIAVVAKEFGVLPSIVARELDRDVAGVTLMALPMLRYAEAYRAYRRANEQELRAWEGSAMMERVKDNDFAAAARAIAAGGE